MVNTIQGISDNREKMRPIVPAVDGMVIKMPEMMPAMAAFLHKCCFYT